METCGLSHARVTTHMREHHTRQKGDLGVLKAQLDLFEQGFMICVPQTEQSLFDLVTYKMVNSSVFR